MNYTVKCWYFRCFREGTVLFHLRIESPFRFAPNIASTRRRFAACWRRENALSGSFLSKVIFTQFRRGEAYRSVTMTTKMHHPQYTGP